MIFKCIFCPKSFNVDDFLKHIQTLHGAEVLDEYKCPLCTDRCYSSLKGLVNHVTRIHSKTENNPPLMSLNSKTIHETINSSNQIATSGNRRAVSTRDDTCAEQNVNVKKFRQTVETNIDSVDPIRDTLESQSTSKHPSMRKHTKKLMFLLRILLENFMLMTNYLVHNL